MCGICGIFSFNRAVEHRLIQGMTQEMKHRGPDDEGYILLDTNNSKSIQRRGEDTVDLLKDKMEPITYDDDFKPNLVFGHRRLSIIDLSEKGHQPMGRQGNWIVYNGEIYNYIELRRELTTKGHDFITESDTEVILAAYEEWGIDCLKRLNGMWAFALWDQKRESLICSRDRFGIKPFYFSRTNGVFLFASEIKSILTTGLINAEANDEAVFDFLIYGFADHLPESFFKEIYHLMPGGFLTVSKTGHIKERQWWKLEKREIFGDTTRKFQEIFEDAVKLRLRSDVPIGSCLSGGLDSSYVVAQMNQFCEAVNTFSAVYGKGIHGDESEFIDALVNHTRAVKHTIIPCSQALELDFQNLVFHQEEPFGSSAIFAQWKVMELAKTHGVKVLLNGQGADELLGGYHQFFGIYFSNLLKHLCWKKLAREVRTYLNLHRNPEIIKYAVYHALPRRIQSVIRTHAVPVKREFRKKNAHRLSPLYPYDLNEVFSMYVQNNLPQLLRFEDKNSMAFSRETRLPFLDYRLVEFVHSLPVEDKIGGGLTKRILRRAMNGIVPEKISNRLDKIGFGTPEADWFTNELQPFILNILHSDSFASRPYWEVEAVQRLYQNFLNGSGGHNVLWRIISVELWLESFVDNFRRCRG